MPRRRKRTWRTGSITYRGARALLRWRDSSGRRRAETVAAELAERALAVRVGRAAAVEAGVQPARALSDRLEKLGDAWFIAREGPRNRANQTERRYWENHIRPFLGRLRPDEVTTGHLRAFVREKLARGRIGAKHAKLRGLSPTTVHYLMAIVSSLFTSLVGDGMAAVNPCRALDEETRRKTRPAYDWRNTPFIEAGADRFRVLARLPEPTDVMFAIGVMRGARPGELMALRWPCVDLEHRLLHIRATIDARGREGPPKSGRSRTVTISDALYPYLAAWRLKNAGGGLVFPPLYRRARHLDPKTPQRHLDAAFKELGLTRLTWYNATRHTYASHFVLEGGSLEVLAKILGHSSTRVTERYAHLQSHRLRPEDVDRAQVAAPAGKLVQLGISAGSAPRGTISPAAKKRSRRA